MALPASILDQVSTANRGTEKDGPTKVVRDLRSKTAHEARPRQVYDRVPYRAAILVCDQRDPNASRALCHRVLGQHQ